MPSKFRKESDWLGEVLVPPEAYYGSQTQRAMNNFKISGLRFPSQFIRNYALLKKASAKANMKLKKLDPSRGKAIVRASEEVVLGKLSDQFLLDVYQAGAGTSTNMNLNEVISSRATEILGKKRGERAVVHPNDHVNMSQSTNDTFHSVTHITAYLAVKEKLVPALKKMEKELKIKSKKFAGIKKSARTHGMFAVPITLGQEFSGYFSTITKRRKFIEQAAESLRSLNLGGTAVGTGINAPKGFSRLVLKEINRETGIKFRLTDNMFSMTQNTEAELQTIGALKALAASLVKMADDIIYLSSSDVDEISIPVVQPGSSIMPGKANPSMAEMLKMVSYQVMGSDLTVTLAVESGKQDLNVMMPLVAYNLLFSIEILSNAIESFTEKLISGIKPNVRRMKENLKRNPFTKTSLAPKIGYDKTAEIIKMEMRRRKRK
jgi:fumarate hydratase class II